MMKPIAILLLCAALASGGNAAAEPAPYKPSAQLTAKGDPAHLAAIKRLLQALEMPLAVRAGMNAIPRTERERSELGAHMARHASDDDFCSVLAPSYLPYISAEQADRLATHYRTSTGRRRVIAMLAREGAIQGEKNPLFTPAELREIAAIDALPGAKALVKERQHIQQANIAAVSAWSTEYQRHYLQQALANLAEITIAQRNYKTGDPGEKFTIRSTGLATLDKYLQIVAESSIASVNANRMLHNDLAGYRLDQLLNKDRLVSASGIALSRQSLSASSERIERYLHEMDLQQNAYRERIAAAAPDKQSLASFEPGMLRQYDDLVRFGENQRALMDVLGRLLDFAESRLGHVKAGEQNLLFETDEDAQLYARLLEQARVLIGEEDRMNTERTRRVDDALKRSAK